MNPIVRNGALMGALGASVFVSYAGPGRRSLQDHEIVMDKELLVTAAEVVDSPLARYPGPWSFGHLVEEAFGKEKAADVVETWLWEWADGDLPGVGGVGRSPREKLEELLIRPWQEADGYDPDADLPWRPKMENAPFRLLAIVNRMDLSLPMASFLDPSTRSSRLAGYYSGPREVDRDAGEGRLVFGVTDQAGKPLEPGVTLIFEYGLDAGGGKERLYDWAMAWHELGGHQQFDSVYRGELAKLTRTFTDKRPDQSSGRAEAAELSLHERLGSWRSDTGTQLMRIRTNDGAFGEVREFREFAWSEKGLIPAPLAGTPREEFFRKGTRENRFLTRWLRGQRGRDGIVPVTSRDREGGEVPSAFALPNYLVKGKDVPVVAMVAPVPENNADYHWDGWGLNDSELRQVFSMQTCCGCHCGDTNTEFFHIAPRERGQAAPLSKFLRTDESRWRPVDPASKRGYLSAEMEVRRDLFEAVLNPKLRYREIKAIRESRTGRGH